MAQMTKRERVLRTLSMQETDRVPIYDILQNDALIEHYAGEKLTVEEGSRITCRAAGRCLDMTRMVGGPQKPGIERQADGFLIQRERWQSWIIERPFHDLPTCVEWIKGEIARVKNLRFDKAYAHQLHEHLRQRQADFGDDTVLVLESGVGLTEMYHATGLELFSYLLADVPDLVIEWLDARHQAELRRVEAIADPELIPVALPYDDIAYKTGTIFSPRWLREHHFPRLKKLVETWQERGVKCIYHSDGNLWDVMDDLVATGIDGLNPIEVAAGMSVKAVRQKYPRLCLAGGVDVSQLLPLGTPAEVREACRENIAATGGIGYFLGSTTELHWEIPLPNIIAMFETAWETAR